MAVTRLYLLAALAPYLALVSIDAWMHEKARRVPRLEKLLHASAALAPSLGLAVHAGHGLTYENVAHVAAIREIEELNIGHSVVSRAVLIGMERAVREMKDIIEQARR